MNDQEDEELKKIRLKKMEEIKNRLSQPQKPEGGVITVNSTNFYEVITKANLSIVDLWADWCMPCKMMGPIFKKLANSSEYKDVVFCSLNADQNPQILQRFGVQGIPTFLMFSRGKFINKIVGAVGEHPLRNALNAALKKYLVK
ncbi:MAG: thioredoxin family protein [Candidatus Helarchaeota archaeon]